MTRIASTSAAEPAPPASFSPGPEPVLLIIADISGYTRYMTANAKALAHSQAIITELVTTIVQQVELPLAVAKLEGDAVFLYCRKEHGPVPWPEAKQLIGPKLLAFFRLFSAKVAELSQSTACTCGACTHIDRLRLKIIVHSGEALFHRVFHFLELAGVDVIIAHRLLKNSLRADQYLLLTAAARADVQLPSDVPLVESSESYEDIGRVETLVLLPDHDGATAGQAKSASFFERVGRSWRLFWKLWFSPLTSRGGLHRDRFRNLVVCAGDLRCLGFALCTLLLTPLFLPAGMLVALFHSMASSPLAELRSWNRVPLPSVPSGFTG